MKRFLFDGNRGCFVAESFFIIEHRRFENLVECKRGILVMIKHVIFDFDGTIVDSISLSIELFNELAIKYKFNKIVNDELEYLRSLSFMERCRAVKVPLYRIPMLGIEIIIEK
jgi:hypothetical protein